MYGVGGILASQVLDLHGGQAALVGVAFGLVGLAIAYLLFSVLQRAESPAPFSTADLIGRDAYVQVAIPAGRYGSVLVKAEGQTHEYSATSAADISVGSMARVSGVTGSGLIVEPVTNAGGKPAQEGGTRGG
jgi:membrane protein implicated in regulation of membrane protease activity